MNTHYNNMHINTLTKEVEAISKSYAQKYEITRDPDWFILKLQEELGELIQSYLMMVGQARSKDKTPEELKKGFYQEIADVFCHTLLLAEHYGIDIEQEVKEKWLIKIGNNNLIQHLAQTSVKTATIAP